jgi:hypothetical protein
MTDLRVIVQCWDKDKTKFGRCVPGEMMFVLDEREFCPGMREEIVYAF